LAGGRGEEEGEGGKREGWMEGRKEKRSAGGDKKKNGI